MTEQVVQEVDTAEAFRIAAATARQALMAGPPKEPEPNPEPGSSPASGSESDVPPISSPEAGDAKPQDQKPEDKKPEGVTIDPKAAWDEYKTDEERAKALAHNKAYGIEMAKKAREESERASALEAQLAARKEEMVAEEPVIEAPKDLTYDEWVKVTLEKPETEEQKRIAKLAFEYNQLVAEKVTPASAAVESAEQKAREAMQVLKDREIALKFLQGRKDQSLYIDDIAEAKEMLNEARLEFNTADNSVLKAKLAFKEAEQAQLAKLGVLRSDSMAAHESEIVSRKDSATRKKADAETSERQLEVDKAWTDAKLAVVKARGLDEAAQQVLMDAADGAIIRAANAGKSITPADFVKFIDDSLKPIQSVKDKAREEAVRTAAAIVDEPTPHVATSDKPNLDAQPISYDEWKTKARKTLQGK